VARNSTLSSLDLADYPAINLSEDSVPSIIVTPPRRSTHLQAPPPPQSRRNPPPLQDLPHLVKQDKSASSQGGSVNTSEHSDQTLITTSRRVLTSEQLTGVLPPTRTSQFSEQGRHICWSEDIDEKQSHRTPSKTSKASFGGSSGTSPAKYTKSTSKRPNWSPNQASSSSGADTLQGAPTALQKFCAPFVILRRKATPYCRTLNKNRYFQFVMLGALVCALFLPDLWILGNRPDNADLDVILVFLLTMFLFELVVQSLALTKTYLGSFFFYMDLLGAASLLMDMSFVTRLFSSQGSSMSGNVTIMRAARMAKLGARAGRFTKLVKLLRFLPGMVETKLDQGTAKVISSQLITALSTRVSCLIIIMVMVMPLFTMWTQPVDLSMKSWLDVLDKTLERRPEHLSIMLKKFEDFYKDKSHYPFRLVAKTGTVVPAAVSTVIPWSSSRSAPQRETNVFKQEGVLLICEFNFQRPNQVDSVLNMLLLVVIVLLMVGFSLVLSSSVSAIVLRPLEKLLKQVRLMASTIFESVTNMAVTMTDSKGEADVDVEDEDKETLNNNALGTETELLEKVVHKLAVLSELTMNKASEGTEVTGWKDKQNPNGSAFYCDDTDSSSSESDEQTYNTQCALVEAAGLSLELLDSWSLNPLELDKARTFAAATFFIGPHNHGIHFDPGVMQHFLEVLESAYLRSCPYHNWFHAVDVQHCVYRLLVTCHGQTYFSNIDRYALLVSAVAHDVGHMGLNNNFLIETGHELALRYNDKSPLESMHTARLFEILNVPKCNVFATLTRPQFKEARKRCIEAILWTDNIQHFSLIKELQILYEVNSEVMDASKDLWRDDAEEWPANQVVECLKMPEARRLLGKLILHLADISNSLKPFRICSIWAFQVLDEFFLQGDAEKRQGIPVQALNDREKVNKAFSQVGFIEFLLSPLVFAAAKVLHPIEPLQDQMILNVKTWVQQWELDANPPPSEEERHAVEERLAKLEMKHESFRT